MVIKTLTNMVIDLADVPFHLGARLCRTRCPKEVKNYEGV